MTTSRLHPLRRHRSAWRSLTVWICVLVGLSSATAIGQGQLEKSGTVKIEQVQLAFIGSGNLGGGTLQFRGETHRFTVGGLGIGGFGVSKITATGDVYNLRDLRFFPGAYGQARYGVALGNASTGELWLENSNGVVLKLKADRQGLALSLGADAVYINFK